MNLINFFVITLALLPGILLMTKDEKRLYQNLLQEEKIPSLSLRILNHIILAFPLAILGLFFFEPTGYTIISENGVSFTSFILSMVVALLNVAFYYLYLKKNIPFDIFNKIEQSRSLGVFTRLFYGGVVEEFIFRFGLMSFFTWIFNLFLANIIWSGWIANVLSTLLFALAHLPSIKQLQLTNTKLISLYTNSANGILGLLCGWLYMEEGLLAAIMCHMIFHLVWFLFEKIGHYISVNGKKIESL